MAGNGDKQPLTAPDNGNKAAVGIITRTKRNISTVLREKSQKRSGKGKENDDDRGWQNPSYEMTEPKASESSARAADKIPACDGDASRESERRPKKGRKTGKRDRQKTKDRDEAHEMEQREMEQNTSNESHQTTVKIVDETNFDRDEDQREVKNQPITERKAGLRGRKKPTPSAQENIPLTTLRPGESDSAGARSSQNSSDQVLGIIVHQCDRLDSKRWQLSRPMVRVHLIDTSSGEPLLKQDPQRHVSYFYEPDDVAAILPVMTQPGTGAGAGLLVWDELLLFNEPFSRLAASETQVCVMFELTTAAPQLCTVAWAFLRLRGACGRLNTEQRLRLQLFRPPAEAAVRSRPIYSWWRSGGRHKLPATLHVTAKAVTPPTLEPGPRSLFPTQPERSSGRPGSPEAAGRRASEEQPAPPAWSRLSGQQCRLPNTSLLTLADDAEACQALRFDGAGDRLACCVQRGSQYPVLVYRLPTGARTHALLGHAGLVYDVCWADERLLTASADWTARLWWLQEAGGYQTLVLPHPGYVYAAAFQPAAPRFVVTGCFDGVVRVWKCSARDAAAEPRLCDELAAGPAPVNSLCCAPDGSLLYAGDARGQLNVWAWCGGRGRAELTLERRVSPPEVAGAAINQLELHPAGRRLFVQARDGVIVALDTRHMVVMQTLGGHLNSRALVRGCLTPCGSYYLSGSEDGCVHVWNADTGERCAAYTALKSTRPAVSVHFHPWEHMLAVATYRDPLVTVQVLGYERGASGAALGLSLLPRAIQPAAELELGAAPGAAAPLPPPPPLAPADQKAAEEEDRRFQVILDRLDSVIDMARAGPAARPTGAGASEARSRPQRAARGDPNVSQLSAASAPASGERDQSGERLDRAAPTAVRSRRRRQRRELKAREALSRTDPDI